LEKWMPFAIWGSLGTFLVTERFDFVTAQSIAVGFMVAYATVALLWLMLKPRVAFKTALACGVGMFFFFTLVLHGWGKGLVAMAAWFSSRFQSVSDEVDDTL
jgi:hypothetical protein